MDERRKADFTPLIVLAVFAIPLVLPALIWRAGKAYASGEPSIPLTVAGVIVGSFAIVGIVRRFNRRRLQRPPDAP
jgi:hypothetical protein